MARLFTAVELAPDIRLAIGERQRALATLMREQSLPELRLVRPEQLHLTLVFIGEVDDERAAAVEAVMRPDIPVDPFDIELSSCGVFPARGSARVLWLGVGRGAGGLEQLFDVVARRARAAGVSIEGRPFTPHLTVGRWPGDSRSRPTPQLPDPGVVAAQRVAEVTLFQSRLTSRGAEHAVVTRATLRGGP
jgi:2'-5' RNA ligase